MIVVLRLGHRPGRDPRVTTHVALVARAFGAQRMVLSSPDKRISDAIDDVSGRWGGTFTIEGCEHRLRYVKGWKGSVVHLTMYGEPLDDVIPRIRKLPGDLLVIVGAGKVPRAIYDIADYNVAVGPQPHSEVAALAMFLDRYFGGRELSNRPQGKLRIVPVKKGKRVECIPSRERCLSILGRYCDPPVVRHSLAVTDLSARIARKAGADERLVEAGALLHDIGRSRTHGIRHGVEGVAIARAEGLPESIQRIIERHLGGGIDKEEAIKLGLPPKDYSPETLEEKIVAHADNLIDRGKKQPIAHVIETLVQEGKPQVAKKVHRLHEELSDRCGVDLDLV